MAFSRLLRAFTHNNSPLLRIFKAMLPKNRRADVQYDEKYADGCTAKASSRSLRGYRPDNIMLCGGVRNYDESV